MSDAHEKQSVVAVDRCKYRHNWIETQVTEDEDSEIICGVCRARPKAREQKEAEAIVHLRKLLKPGDTIYTIIRHVSRSGMSRNIDLYFIPKDDPTPMWISAYVGHAIGQPQSRRNWEKSQGLTVGGCEMDMGFHLVYSLGRVLWPEGFWGARAVAGRVQGYNKAGGRNGDTLVHDKDGGYALQQRWL